MPNDIAGSIPAGPTPQFAPSTKGVSSYWFDDGSVIARLRDHNFKVHKSLLDRDSPYVASLPTTNMEGHTVPVLRIPDERASIEDFTALLGHLYHNIPLDQDSPFTRVAPLLRVTSERHLHYPSIHELARKRFHGLYPSTVEGFVHPEDPEEALRLALEYDVHEVQKPLYYSVATTSHFEHGSIAEAHPTLPEDVTRRCASLQDSLISHFTPILFTVATASHMACTDVFAESWMPLVIAPALEHNGLCTPVETLKTIQRIRWEDHGLCAECCKEKREEWEEEAKNIWDKVDEWLDLKGT